MTVTIYYNPNCSKCRATLALLEERGIAAEQIHYLEKAPSVAALAEVLTKLGMGPQAIIRFDDVEAKALGIAPTDERPDDEWLQLISAHPKLLVRPIVIHGDKAAIGRPPENVLGIL